MKIKIQLRQRMLDGGDGVVTGNQPGDIEGKRQKPQLGSWFAPQ